MELETPLENSCKPNEPFHQGPPDPSVFSKFPGYKYLFAPSWLQEDPIGPLHLDIGAGMGRFLMSEAEKNPNRKYLGIDPDYQCVKKNLQKLANREKRGVEMMHVRFFYGSVYDALKTLSRSSVDVGYINYPDPWFKRRHLKRRLVSPNLFKHLKPVLKPKSEIFIQTDIDEYAKMIEEVLAQLKNFAIQTQAHALFKELTTTLYQEKAEKKGHSRHCYHLTYLEN